MNEVPLLMYLTWQAVPPQLEPTIGDEPSVGALLIEVVAVSRSTTTFEKSPLGFVQLTVTCVSPLVVPAPVVPAGERLSMVMVALEVSVRTWEALVLVKAVTVPVVA